MSPLAYLTLYCNEDVSNDNDKYDNHSYIPPISDVCLDLQLHTPHKLAVGHGARDFQDERTKCPKHDSELMVLVVGTNLPCPRNSPGSGMSERHPPLKFECSAPV
jgi:hypothetical protein